MQGMVDGRWGFVRTVWYSEWEVCERGWADLIPNIVRWRLCVRNIVIVKKWQIWWDRHCVCASDIVGGWVSARQVDSSCHGCDGWEWKRKAAGQPPHPSSIAIVRSRFPCCVLLALSWKIQAQISWVGQSTRSLVSKHLRSTQLKSLTLWIS